VPAKAKVILDTESNEPCVLFFAFHTKNSSFSDQPPALQGSIFCEKLCTNQELVDICATWVVIDEDEEIINEEVEEALEQLVNDSPLPSFDNFDPDD
jgi:hypothetical protein